MFAVKSFVPLPFLTSDLCFCGLTESVCAGCRWRLWGQKECLSSTGHAARSSNWPPYPTHAQHCSGKPSLLNQTHACTQKTLTGMAEQRFYLFIFCLFSTCYSAHRTQMRMWLWRLVSFGSLWLSNPSVKKFYLDIWFSESSVKYIKSQTFSFGN